MEQLFNTLAKGLKKTMADTGFNTAIIGISGGIDSALTAAISVKALGANHVNLFYLPYKTSDPRSYDDARLVADHLQTSLTFTDITSMADPYINSLINSTPRRKGNILARIRMVVLYDYSAMYNGLVIGCGNKSEILLGYMTLFGDAAYAINPIGELYKTEVWELAKFIKLPERIINKAPTADLWEGQTDEGELGFSYPELDKILPILEKNNCNVEDTIKHGFTRHFAETVAKMVKTNEFKRRIGVIISKNA